MNRFLFYLILISMMTYMVSTTPRTLIEGSANGSVPSLFLAIIAGMVVTYITISKFSHFPGQGLPEILKSHTPKWFATPILFIFSIVWFYVGLSTLITYTFIINRFLLPEMSIYVVVLTFVLIITYGIFMTTKNIFYMSEIIFLIVIPFILFVQIKAYFSPSLNLDYLRISIMQINQLPNYKSFMTATFIAMGAANLVIFNRYFKELKKPTWKGMSLLTFFFSYILLTTYFLPMGFGGFEALDNALYPWILTSDSIRMKFGLIERIVFIFIGAFLALSVVTITMQWHISIQLLSSVFYFKRFKWKSVNLTLPFFVLCFWAFSIYRAKTVTSEALYKGVEFFDMVILPITITLLIGSLWLAKRGAASKCPDTKK